jgi:hypothetical protein
MIRIRTSDKRIRIRTSDFRIRIQEAQKHSDLDPGPQHYFVVPDITVIVLSGG